MGGRGSSSGNVGAAVLRKSEVLENLFNKGNYTRRLKQSSNTFEVGDIVQAAAVRGRKGTKRTVVAGQETIITEVLGSSPLGYTFEVMTRGGFFEQVTIPVTDTRTVYKKK